VILLEKDSSIIHEGLQPEMYFALGVAAAVKRVLFGEDCVVTSLLDGKHNCGSLHPKGFAADLRTIDMTLQQRYDWFAALKLRLEPMGFDVVWEGGVGATPATTGAHIHIEYDPKGRVFWSQLP
jgi:hypothetical protein